MEKIDEAQNANSLAAASLRESRLVLKEIEYRLRLDQLIHFKNSSMQYEGVYDSDGGFKYFKK